VRVTVEVHAASWDVQQYIRTQLQLQGQQQQQGQPPVSQADVAAGGSPEVFGPYAATLTKDKHSNLRITRLQHKHEPQTYLQHLAGEPHRVVLQKRVSAGGKPFVRLPNGDAALQPFVFIEAAEGCSELRAHFHTAGLCVAMQVPGSDPPHFKMHLKPGTPEQPGNKDAKTISRAGEGPGLQVAPGSVSEVRVGTAAAFSTGCHTLIVLCY
jgi:hypothetical protein